MVDVGDKPSTARRAVARAVLRMSPETAAAVVEGDAPKGDVLGTARIAGIQAAKRTAGPDPALPPAGPRLRGRRRARGRGGRRRRPHRRGAHHRPHRGRDGGDGPRPPCRPDGLRHGQGLERGVEIAEVVLLEKTAAGRTGGARAVASGPCGLPSCTVSTSVSRGDTPDESGTRLASLAEAAGAKHRVDGGDPRRPRAHRGPPAPLRRRRLLAGLHHRGHRLHARRRHARGQRAR